MELANDLCPQLALEFGRGIQFAEDCSRLQLDSIGAPSTSAARGANARSYLIGSLGLKPIGGYELDDAWQDYNRVSVKDLDSALHFWLKSRTALQWQFDFAGPALFPYPSNLRLLAYEVTDDLSEILFFEATVARSQKNRKKFLLESAPMLVGEFPLYEQSGPFDPGPPDPYIDIFQDDSGEETGS